MLNQQTLNHQADTIERALYQHRCEVRVTGGVLAPRWVQFHLYPGQTRIAQIRALLDDIALALGVDSCRLDRKNTHVTLEVPRPDPQPVHLLPLQKSLEREHIPPLTATLGLADDGAPILVRLTSPQVAHLLIAGTTGSGKTALARTLIASLVMRHRPRDLALVLIDPKRRAFGPLAALPHLIEPVITEPDQAADTLARLVALMLQRDRQAISTPHVVVVIDELADLLMVAGKAARGPITRLAQRGREAGIHLVACTQKPTARAVDTLAKANFPVRLVGQVTSPEEAKIATGYAGTGAEKLRGPGEFLAVNGGQVTRLQAAYIAPRELGELIAQRYTDRPSPAPALTLPQSDNSADPRSDEKLDRYADQVRGLWPSLLDDQGNLKWGAKATLAEELFGQRNTGGHYGRTVDQVIEKLQSETVTTYAAAATLAPRRLVTSKTTTTTITTLKRISDRFRRRIKVVVVAKNHPEPVEGTQYQIPHLWGSSRLIIAIRTPTGWHIERIPR